MDVSLKMYKWVETFEIHLAALVTTKSDHSEHLLISGRLEIQVGNLELC